MPASDYNIVKACYKITSFVIPVRLIMYFEIQSCLSFHATSQYSEKYMSPTTPLTHSCERPTLFKSSSTTPSADQPGFFPFAHKTIPASHPTSQLGDLAMGGYCLPSRSTLGSHSHRSSSGIVSSTLGTCIPQPHQVALSEE